MLTTYNGISVPAIMYGTAWKKEATDSLVKQALSAGFKAIDTANQLKHYDEKLVGDAVNEAFTNGLKREKVFLQTKFTSIDGQDHRLPYDAKADLTTQVHQSFASSLQHLNTDYLDSYVLHGPHYRNKFGVEDWEVWRAMEDLYAGGKTKMLGASNINCAQLRELCEQAKTKPMMVQNRCYAAQGWDAEMRALCQSEGIIYQGFSLLTANPHVVMSNLVQSIAARVGGTPEQVIFKFSMQVGMMPLTGTTNARHMSLDLKAESFELTPDEVARIENCAISSHR